MSFTSFGLSDSVVKGVSACGFTSPTEIQHGAIPLAVQGLDIIGCAPTGTGKTAAFVLPILDRLTRSRRPARNTPRCLVLTPTRELAQQIESAVQLYGKYTGIRSLAVYGGVGISDQMRILRRGVDIVTATPGRLLDHIDRNSIDLSTIEVLVIDEADRMFDMGFIHDVRRIIHRVPSNRQTLLFSATMSREVRQLVAEVQTNPHTVEIGNSFTPVDTVAQEFYQVTQQTKMDLLLHILENGGVETMLVFSRTKHGADKITRRLVNSGISSAAIHADRTQSQRQFALDGFKRRKFRVLVATDLAARGIDVERISHVVNYDTPAFAEDYIHRIGRTGRADSRGTAVTFVSSDEKKYLRRIEFLTRKRYEVKRYPGFAYDEPVVAEAPVRRNLGLPRQGGRLRRLPRFA